MLRCEYTVHFYGAVIIPNKICMVTEFAKYGSLDDLIYKRNIDVPESMRIKLPQEAKQIGLPVLHTVTLHHQGEA